MKKAKTQNFLYLFVGILFLLLVIPLYRDLTDTDHGIVSEMAFSVFLIIGIWSLRRVRRWFPLALGLAAIGILGNAFAVIGESPLLSLVSLLSFSAFLLLAIGLAARQVFTSRSIELNNIVGAICIYMLMGVIWAVFYTIINALVPGSFAGTITGNLHQQVNDFFYFSMVTLTSLGYGDIAPTGATARALATLEVMLGQFYIAVLVAGLVANYLRADDSVR